MMRLLLWDYPIAFNVVSDYFSLNHNYNVKLPFFDSIGILILGYGGVLEPSIVVTGLLLRTRNHTW